MSVHQVLEPAVVARRVRVGVRGTVQGVGFRPFVYRLAQSLELGGFVRNDSAGVTIEVEGGARSVDAFLGRLVSDAPSHARVGEVVVTRLTPTGDDRSFAVASTRRSADAFAAIPADLATCAECLRELWFPFDRRYRYPFITCTACGPRFTVAQALPYDRAATTMAAFTMCPACRAEYEDAQDRRFHSETNACPACGPRVSLADGGGTAVSTDGAVDAVAAAAAALRSGAIVAIKGLGGFHLACRADDSSVVARLRRAKQRDAKPFALMARDLDAAKALVVLDADECALLTGSARPILLGRRRDDAVIAAEVAPARRELGVMLPYTPLHHLLMADITAPLVMTSGNRSDEPIACRNDDALRRLSPIADLFLLHDRDIAARCEDSVVRVVAMRDRRDTLMIRRARGYVPEPIGIPVPTAETILATGGQLKNTVSLARGDRVVVGPHTGDLADAATFAAFARGVEHLERLTGAAPAVVAHDRHPDYPSTTYALARDEHRRVGVQHHHAHLAACLAEYGETEPAVGVIFDGSGFGSDGLVWGGEFLFGDLGTFERLGHLRAVAMPGGERAVREPWRMACAWLADAHGDVPPIPEPLRQVVDDTRWRSVAKLAASRMHSPLTTSVGRLLDACAAITGLCPFISYEGQAAIEFEADARTLDPSSAYPITIDAAGDEFVVDPREMILSVAGDAERGVPRTQISSRMHSGLVYAARTGARLAAARTGARTVVLSGGVFQNVLMLEALVRALMEDGMRVLVPRRLPPNDGGLSFGQAAVAAWRRRQDVSGDTRTGA